MKPQTPPNSRTRQTGSAAREMLLEARARAALCVAFEKLTTEHNLPVVAAARVLGLAPSTLSGKVSLPTRYRDGGIEALMLSKRPRPSRITKASEPLKRGFDLFYDGKLIATLDEKEGA